MSIIYSAIVKNKKNILCEYTESSGNFQQICTTLLNKITFNIHEKETQLYLDYDENFEFFVLNVLKSIYLANDIADVANDSYLITFICFVNKENNSDSQAVLNYLTKIKKLFFNKYGDESISNFRSFSLELFLEALKTETLRWNKKIKNSTISTRTSTKKTDLFLNSGT